NASPFWIMLLLSSTAFEHGMTDADRTPGTAPDYQSGGQEFESLRARQQNQAINKKACWCNLVPTITQQSRESMGAAFTQATAGAADTSTTPLTDLLQLMRGRVT